MSQKRGSGDSSPPNTGVKSDTLHEIIQTIEVKSMIALQKSMADGDPKHHKQMIAEAKQALQQYYLSLLPEKQEKDIHIEVGDPEEAQDVSNHYMAYAKGYNQAISEMEKRIKEGTTND